MPKDIRLSISMLLSRYTDQLESCLQSIEPFFSAFPTEFIIVDTGAPKEAVTLAKKYATKIVKFEWCNDFSKARNAGLSQCHGEWFLFLDDDEYFDDVSEIIAFLCSKEQNRYTALSHYVHDYLDYDSPDYCCGRVTRMVRRTDDLRFIHRVHECFNFAPEPECIKQTQAFIHHYGYAAKTPEDRHSHAKRNLPLLIEECRQYPDDYRMILQLANEFRILSQPENVHHTLKPWMDKLLSGSLYDTEYMHAWMLDIYYDSLFALRDFDEMQNLSLQLLSRDDLGFVCKWTIAYYGGIACALHSDYPLAGQVFDVFFLINDYMDEHPQDHWMQNKYQYNSSYIKDQTSLAYKFASVIAYNCKDYDKARQCLARIESWADDIFGLNDTCLQIAKFVASQP